MTRALAMEFAKTPIRVNAIAPGGTNTPMNNNSDLPGDADFELHGCGTYNFSLPHNACADSVDSGYVAGCCENEGYGGYVTPGMWTQDCVDLALSYCAGLSNC